MKRILYLITIVLVTFNCTSLPKSKKVIFLAGPPSHRPGDHEHYASSVLLSKALKEAKLDISTEIIRSLPDQQNTNAIERLKQADTLVFICDGEGGHLAEKKLKAFKKILNKDIGLVAIHYAVHINKKQKSNKVFSKALGGYYQHKVSTNPHWYFPSILNKNHSITNGVKPFNILDEWYYNIVLNENAIPILEGKPNNIARQGKTSSPQGPYKHILANKGRKETVMWAFTRPNKGRSIGFTGGHYLRNFYNDNFRKLLLNAILWTAKSPIPKNGVNSSKPDINSNIDYRKSSKFIHHLEDINYQEPPLYFYPKTNKPRHLSPKVLLDFPQLKNKYKNLKMSAPKKTSFKDTTFPADKFSFLDKDKFKINLFASSPQLFNPTRIDIDNQGRVWVAEGVRYRSKIKRKKEGDRIVVLTDKNNDGVAEKSHIFVQDPSIAAPLGIAVIGNKIIVMQSPNMIIYTDVNNNAIYDKGIDKKEILLSNIGKANHDHSLHTLRIGPNGQWYFSVGNTGANTKAKDGSFIKLGSFYNRSELIGKKSSDGHSYLGGALLRMNPDGTNLQVFGHNFRNSYGQYIDSFGDAFQNDNDDPPNCRISWLMEYGNAGYSSYPHGSNWRLTKRPEQKNQVAHWHQEDPGSMPAGNIYGGGSPAGLVINEGDELGEEFRGMLLSTEPGKNLIFSIKPKISGAGFDMSNINTFLTTNPNKQYMGSDFLQDKKFKSKATTELLPYLFRPSDIAIGIDGAIYIADWFDPRVGGHSTQDEQGIGAIYRITRKGKKHQRPKLDLTTLQGQIEAFKSPAINVRGTARYLLQDKAKQDKHLVVKALKEQILNHTNPYIKIRGLWLLADIDKALALPILTENLNSNNQRLQITSYRILRHIFAEKQPKKLLDYAKRINNNSSIGLRREVVISLRNYSFDDKKNIIINLFKKFHNDILDPWYLEALGATFDNQEKQAFNLFKPLFSSNDSIRWSEIEANIAWRFHNDNNITDLEKRVLATQLPSKERKKAIIAIAKTPTKKAFDSMTKLKEKIINPELQKQINWALKSNQFLSWKGYSNAKFFDINQNYISPRPAKSKKVTTQQILKLKGNSQQGKLTIAACYTCHKINGQGIDFGPNLTNWGKNRSRDIITQAIINPDQDIAHGFAGSELRIKKKYRVQGIVEGNFNTHVSIKTHGGQVLHIDSQYVNRIGNFKNRGLKKSLMIPAQDLGLSNQQIRNIVEYLKVGTK